MDEVRSDTISRRAALKRVGAGAAIAWSAPTVLSIGARASAGSPPCNPVFCALRPTPRGQKMFRCQPTNPADNPCVCECGGASVHCPEPDPCNIALTCVRDDNCSVS
jgi:hypothetical protein